MTLLVGCSTTGSGDGNAGEEARLLHFGFDHDDASRDGPGGGEVLDRSVNRGENPSAADFNKVNSLKPPLSPLYIRITTEPAAPT